MSIKSKKSKGVSLVELMIGLFIASLISTSIYYLYGSGLRTFYQVESTSDLQDEANVIFSMIERDLARGGFVHPIRGDVSSTANCKATISPENAVKIVSGSEISSCFDKPSSDGTVAFRYRVTYKLGDGTSGLEDTNTLYKKTIRTDNCTSSISSSDPNYASTVHDWQPVSTNINTIAFTKPTVDSVTKNDIVNIDINFMSRDRNDYKLDFNKRVFLRNRDLTKNTGLCNNKCPNAKEPFSNYVMSNNTSHWNPASKNIPNTRVVIQNGFVSAEDKLEWNTTLASDYGLTVSYNTTTGVLTISGTATGDKYEKFIKTIKYVNKASTPSGRTDSADPDRTILLALGATGFSPIPRAVGADYHFYDFIERTSGGSGSWSPGGIASNGWYWWGEAELEAENSRYYNLKGYLATVTNSAENNYIKDRIRKSDNTIPAGWIGGSDHGDDGVNGEGTWKWMGGPEEGNIFFSDDGNCTNDSWVIPWAGNCATSEPNNNMGSPWWKSESSRGSNNGYSCELMLPGSISAGAHCCTRPNASTSNSVCDGEHYTQYKSDGDWNDLFLPGYNQSVYKTDGYVIEFSTNFVSTNTCGNANADQRAACVNYLLEESIVLKDFTYTDEDMLDICDITP